MYDEGLTFSEGFTAVRSGSTWIFLDSTADHCPMQNLKMHKISITGLLR
jgi:hypothetical protein